MKQTGTRLLALLLALSMLLSLAACGGEKDTADAAKTGWLNLDGAKQAKLDEGGKAEVREDGIYIRSGGLFFDVSEPLAEDDALNIRTSTAVVGVRDACGWVEVEGESLMCVYLLKGQAGCTVLDKDGGVLAFQAITAGQAAKLEADGSITVAEFDTQKAPAFVAEELNGSDDLPTASDPVEPSGSESNDPGERAAYQQPLMAMAEICVLYSRSSLDPYNFATEVQSSLSEKYPTTDSLLSRTLPETHMLSGGDATTILSSYSYAYYDINNNGVDELLVGHNGNLSLVFTHGIGDNNPILCFRGSGNQGSSSVICADGSIVDENFPNPGGQPDILQWRFGTDIEWLMEIVFEEYGASLDRYDQLVSQAGGAVTDFNWHPLSNFAPEGAESQPAGSQPSQEQPDQPLTALPDSFVGEYTPADTATFYPVTFNENGVCSGWGRKGGVGPANHYGSTPLSIVQKGDGSVVVSFEYATYTFFPAGLIPAEYENYMVPDAINLMDVGVTTYGTRTDWYHK